MITGAIAAILLPLGLMFSTTVGLAATFDINGANVFELDGNACHDANTVPPIDWGNQPNTGSPAQCSGTDASPAVGLFNHDYTQAIAPNTVLAPGKTMSNSIICNDAVATTSCLQGAATAGSAVSDQAFQTGGSKDQANPQGSWQCTPKPVTPKDEIDNAYASLITVPVQTATLASALSSGTTYTTLSVSPLSTNIQVGDPIRVGTQILIAAAAAAAGATSITVSSFVAATDYPVGTPVMTTHDLLYMGIERGVTNGTSNAGFWLMQNSITCDPATGLFSGNHANGDFLLFATFNSGGAICPNGATSTACVDSFGWVGGAGGTLPTSPVEGGVACSVSTVDLCGMVNTGNVQTPWAPHNSAAGAIPANGFFEVGVDLSNFYGKLGLQVPCLSTFLADTRASGSQGNAISSVLHDYISGSFSNCQAHVATTPASSAIKLGSSITDTATVTGTPGFPTPTGTVSFFACGPLDPSTITLSGPNCTSSKNGYTVLNNGAGPSPPAAVPLVNGTATSSSFTPTAVGTYCFAATYNGDSNYSPVSESRGTECFVVRNTTTTTTPSSTSIPLGSSVTDTAAVAIQPAGGPAATGTVSFYVCGPTVTPTACTASASNATVLNNGSGPSPPAAVTLSNGSATSASFTPTAVGTYCFLAVYSGDTNYPGSQDNDTTRECFKVQTDTTTTAPSASAIKLGASVTDTATISINPSGGPAPTGAVSFFVCGPFTTATACTSSATGYTVLDQGSGPNPPAAVTVSNASATSSSFTPSAVGIYCFLAIYSGDSNYPSSQDNDTTRECFVVRSSTTVTTPSPGSSGDITLGATVTDTAVVTGNPAGGPTPTGTVSFYVCGPDSPSAVACLSTAGNVTVLNNGTGPTPPAAVTLDVGGSATSASFTPTQAGIYCFLAVYSGDSNYPGSQDNDITRECFTAHAVSPILGSTVSLDDTVKITKNATAGQPSGDMTFTLFGPFTSAANVSCGNSAPVASSPPTVSHTAEQYDASGNGYWNVAVDVPLTNGTTGSTLWYAWGASFAPTNSNYLSGTVACTDEVVNVAYGSTSGFSIPGGITSS